jgi:hypothetical protein
MGRDSGIAWTDHTFNPWWGCTKISAGCANCYAAATDARWSGGKNWGADAEVFFVLLGQTWQRLRMDRLLYLKRERTTHEKAKMGYGVALLLNCFFVLADSGAA